MGLLALQRELAAILLEGPARAAFAADPRGHLRRQGLRGRDLALLSSLVADDVAYFAQRRDVDRHQALRADAPRSVRLLERAHGRLNAYFRARPYSLEDPRHEAEAFAAWARRASRAGTAPAALGDLATFEAAVLRLSLRDHRPATPTRHPRRAPGVRVLPLRMDLVPVLKDPDAEARQGPSWLALRRTEDDVLWYSLSALDADLLRRADGRTPQAAWLAAASPPATARRAARDLAQDGLLSPRATR